MGWVETLDALGTGGPLDRRPVRGQCGSNQLAVPAKIVTQVLEPIDIIARFGENPDIVEVDAHVRKVMQSALDELAAQRRFPIIG